MSLPQWIFDVKISNLYASLIDEFSEEEARSTMQAIAVNNSTDDEIRALNDFGNPKAFLNLPVRPTDVINVIDSRVVKMMDMLGVDRRLMKAVCSQHVARDEISALNYGLVVDTDFPHLILHCTSDVYRTLDQIRRWKVKRLMVIGDYDLGETNGIKELDLTRATPRTTFVDRDDVNWLRGDYCCDDDIFWARRIVTDEVHTFTLDRGPYCEVKCADMYADLHGPNDLSLVTVLSCDCLHLEANETDFETVKTKVYELLNRFHQARVNTVEITWDGLDPNVELSHSIGKFLPYVTYIEVFGNSIPERWESFDNADHLDEILEGDWQQMTVSVTMPWSYDNTDDNFDYLFA